MRLSWFEFYTIEMLMTPITFAKFNKSIWAVFVEFRKRVGESYFKWSGLVKTINEDWGYTEMLWESWCLHACREALLKTRKSAKSKGN